MGSANVTVLVVSITVVTGDATADVTGDATTVVTGDATADVTAGNGAASVGPLKDAADIDSVASLGPGRAPVT